MSIADLVGIRLFLYMGIFVGIIRLRVKLWRTKHGKFEHEPKTWTSPFFPKEIILEIGLF